jgi:hypothetical protein
MHVKERGHEDRDWINPLNAELNPICHLLALLGAHLIFHVSRIRVKLAQDRDKLRAVVSTLMNFCVPYSEGVGWLGKELLVSQAISPSATQCHSAAQHSTAQCTPAHFRNT